MEVNFEYSPVASKMIAFVLFRSTLSNSFATVQLLPPPVVPTTAQCRPNNACCDNSISECLLEVSRAKEIVGDFPLSLSLQPNRIKNSFKNPEEQTNTFAPILGNISIPFSILNGSKLLKERSNSTFA